MLTSTLNLCFHVSQPLKHWTGYHLRVQIQNNLVKQDKLYLKAKKNIPFFLIRIYRADETFGDFGMLSSNPSKDQPLKQLSQTNEGQPSYDGHINENSYTQWDSVFKLSSSFDKKNRRNTHFLLITNLSRWVSPYPVPTIN